MTGTILLLATLKLGTPFSDGMVLQRQMPIRVWGTSDARSEVRVKLGNDTAKAQADYEGNWRVELPPRGASKKPVSMTVTEYKVQVLPVSGAIDTLTVNDILVGEVWFACGQSNMECPIWGDNPRFRDEKGAMMVAMSNNPFIRFVKNQKREGDVWRYSLTTLPLKAEWRQFDSKGLALRPGEEYMLSAVAFYFARELYLATDVPIGIVDSSWGGTPAEAWTPPCTMPAKDLEDNLAARGGKVDQYTPTALFNGLVAPYCPMAMRGFIWYQGCKNVNDSVSRYVERMNLLYSGWAKMFENPDLKLYFAQLAPYQTNWMNICMAQTQFAQSEKNANLVVLADAGNPYDIHPNRKDIVGQRLAMHALRREYGFEMPGDESPVLQKVTFRGNTAVLEFNNVKEWYIYSGNWSVEPAFEMCGADGVWVKAKIANPVVTDAFRRGVVQSDGGWLTLEAEGLDKAVHVRYLGQPRTAGTLYNELSLPLGPFEK